MQNINHILLNIFILIFINVQLLAIKRDCLNIADIKTLSVLYLALDFYPCVGVGRLHLKCVLI